MTFYEKYLLLCQKKGKSPSGAALEIPLSKTTVNRWKNGGGITDANAMRVAAYFRITVEELMDGVDGAKKAPTEISEREFVPSYEDWEKQAESWTDDQLMQAMRKLLDIQQRRRDDGR